MSYLIFKLKKTTISLKIDETFEFEPTQINRIVESTCKLKAGYIIYKNRKINVYDISIKFDNDFIKKFDGLIFIRYKDEFAIKFNGFFKIENTSRNNLDLTIQQLYNIIHEVN